MKKLLDSKFLFILGLSILMLIILVIGAFYLFNDSDATFVKSGYVINPLSSKVEKYFFDKDVSYHENLSSMVEFKDIDNNDAMVSKDSFLHYDDGSLSLLKNGAILDLNSINGKKAVTFYNITNKSIIEKQNDNNYLIKTNGDDIKLGNFIVRINDDKYIIVGNLEAKIPGNNTNVKGDYFEIVYVENGIVNIENKDVKYQVTAEGTFIYLNGLIIDLGNKKISQNGEDVMSLTAITINGNENIEIIPKEEAKTADDNQGGNGNGQGGEEGEDTPGENTQPEEIIPEKTLKVSLKEAQIKSTDVKVKFEMENVGTDDNLMLRVTNLETGVTVDRFEIEADQTYSVSLLSPNTKYLFAVVNSKNNEKYFQKIFETEEFGISLEKSYATDSALGYKIVVNAGTDIKNAKLSLLKYNEELGKNEPVKASYETTNDAGEPITIEKERVIELSSLGGNIEGTHEVFFDNLDSNSIYTAVLNEFSVVTTNFKDIYDITLTSMTLKKKPIFDNPIWNKDETRGGFKLSVDNIADPDNAILNYTYKVYEVDTSGSVSSETAIPEINKSDATPIFIQVGGDGGLKLNHSYIYKVIIEYFDNEKYLEYVTTYSDVFKMEEEAVAAIVPDSNDTEFNRTSYNRIGATIYLTDNSCKIPMPGRDECPGVSNVDIQIIDDPMGNTDNGKNIVKIIRGAEFALVDDRLQYSLDVAGLKENTYYTIKIVNNGTVSGEPVEIQLIKESAKGVRTKKISTFDISWSDKESNSSDVINVVSQFIANDNGEISAEDSARSIKRIDVELYKGNYPDGIHESNEIETIAPVKTFVYTENFNLKDEFYDKGYNISNGLFNLSLDDLKEIYGDNEGGEYYFTLRIKAYYDNEGNNPISISAETDTHAYLANRALFEPDLGEFVLTDPEPIKRGNNQFYQLLTSPDTVIGYRMTTSFEEQKLLAAHYEVKGIRISVFDLDNNQVKFYVMENGILKEKDYLYRAIGSSNFNDPVEVYLEPDVNSDKNTARRGTDYLVGFEVEVMSRNSITYLPINRTGKPRYYGTYKMITSTKEKPLLSMYVTDANSNSVTYKYEIKDIDHSLLKENNAYNLYALIDEEEHLLPIEQVDVENNIFSGKITISNLNKGDYYSLYMKLNLAGDDVKRYPEVSDDTTMLFEGEYVLNQDNFKFNVLPSNITDNKVTIKILADQDLIDRVTVYEVTFSAEGIEPITRKFGSLSTCGLDEDVKCLSVDYDDLREMRSLPITVSVKAAYDSGISGFDYIENSQYMIMQQNNTANGKGYYIGFTEGNAVAVLNETYTIDRGYYKVEYKDETKKSLYYTKIMSPKNVKKDIVSLYPTMNGMAGKVQGRDTVINPKVVRLVNVAPEDNNTFSFNSYTPTITVTNKSYLINGVVANINLSGADYNELCAESSGNECVNTGESGSYYLYVDVYEKDTDLKVGSYKFKIEDNMAINRDPVVAKLDNLRDTTTYYFRVYALLNKNNQKERIQLFDDGLSVSEFKTKDYEFTTLTGSNLISRVSVKSVVKSTINEYKEEANYGDRMLKTTLELVKNGFNYNIEYVLCEDEETEDECANSNIRKTILSTNLNTSKVDYLDLDDDLDYRKNYIIYVYAIYKSYNDQDVRIPIASRAAEFDKIKKPTFNVERKKAIYSNGENYIDITVHVNDSDERLTDGIYSVKLLLGDTPQGNMYVSRDGGENYEPVTNGYEFSALDTNLKIQFRGLVESTKYEIAVSGSAYLDDPTELVPIRLDKPIMIYSANEMGVALGEKANFKGADGIVIVTLPGGSNADNVTEVQYTVGYWANYQNGGFTDEEATFSGTYVLADSDNKFKYNQSADLQYEISPVEFTNGTTCQAIVKFKIEIPNLETGGVTETWVTYTDSFEYGKIEE